MFIHLFSESKIYAIQAVPEFQLRGRLQDSCLITKISKTSIWWLLATTTRLQEGYHLKSVAIRWAASLTGSCETDLHACGA